MKNNKNKTTVQFSAGISIQEINFYVQNTMSLVQSNRSKRSKIQNKVNSRKKRKADTKTKKTNIKHQNLLFKSISTQMSCESSFNKKKLLQTILSMKSGLKRKIFVEKDSLLYKFSCCGGFGLFLFCFCFGLLSFIQVAFGHKTFL